MGQSYIYKSHAARLRSVLSGLLTACRAVLGPAWVPVPNCSTSEVEPSEVRAILGPNAADARL